METFLRSVSLFRWFKNNSCQIMAMKCVCGVGVGVWANIFIFIDLRDFCQNFGARGGNKNKIKISKMDSSIEK